MAKKIEIIGLGAGDLDQLPFGVYKKIMQAQRLYLRTKEHPVIPELEKEGLSYTSFDSIYEKHQQFEAVYEEIAGLLLKRAETEEVVYAVPGHPLEQPPRSQLFSKEVQQFPHKRLQI